MENNYGESYSIASLLYITSFKFKKKNLTGINILQFFAIIEDVFKFLYFY